MYGAPYAGSPATSTSTAGWGEHGVGSRCGGVGMKPWRGEEGRQPRQFWRWHCWAGLGWAPAPGLAWPPPTADNPEPCGSCYHLPPWTTRRISPPFSPPADVLWLTFRKITTPILDTADRSSSGTRSKEVIWHALIKTNFPCTRVTWAAGLGIVLFQLTQAGCAGTVPWGWR